MFVVDTFTDADGTALSDHTPDTGGTWEAMAFSTGGGGDASLTASISGNQLVSSPAATTGVSAVCRNTADPGGDEYDIQVTLSFGLTQSSRYHILCWRMTPTGTADADVDRYMLLGNGSTQAWELYKIVGGALTQLDSAPAALEGNSFDVAVEVRNGSCAVFVDDGGGAGLVQVFSSSDSDITQRGRVGIGVGRTDAGHWADDLQAVAVTGEDQPQVQILAGWVERSPTSPRVQILAGWVERDPAPGSPPRVQILSAWVERGPETHVTPGAWWVRVGGQWVKHRMWIRRSGAWV